MRIAVQSCRLAASSLLTGVVIMDNAPFEKVISA
jgi:hypothetical protein